MTIQVFTVDEGINVDNGSGTTVWDVDNTGAMTVAATSRLTGIVTMGTVGNTFAFPAADGAAGTFLTTRSRNCNLGRSRCRLCLECN